MEMKDHAELSNGEWHHVEMPEKPKINQTAHLAIEENHLYPLDGVGVRRDEKVISFNKPHVGSNVRKVAIIES